MIRNEELHKYIEKLGKRGSKTLSVLGKEMDFINALNTPVGLELMKDLFERHELLLDTISRIKATDEEKLEYKVVRHMLLTWVGRINEFNKKIDEIKKSVI